MGQVSTYASPQNKTVLPEGRERGREKVLIYNWKEAIKGHQKERQNGEERSSSSKQSPEF
jgi:hypothetical protein